MYKMNNILNYDSFLKEAKDWKKMSKLENGTIEIDETPIQDENDIEKLNRTISRIEDKNIDWFCGGKKELEKEYGNIIQPIENRKEFLKTIDVNKDHGYVSLEKTINPDVETKNVIKSIFGLHPGDIGKGEVLLPCIFSDIRMKNREDSEKGDCAVVDTDNKIQYHIEVKSAGSGFTYFDMSKDEKYNYAYSIAKHIISRYQRNKNDMCETIFIFFDNSFGGEGVDSRKGNNEVKGFWWINVGRLTQDKKSEQLNEISSKLMKYINDEFGKKITKSNGSSFVISSNEKGLVIHPRSN